MNHPPQFQGAMPTHHIQTPQFHGFQGGPIRFAGQQSVAELMLDQYQAPRPVKTFTEQTRYVSAATSTTQDQYSCFVNAKTSRTGKLQVDAATMTDPVDESLITPWPAGTANNAKVAEYLTSLRQFLKLSAPGEGKRRLGDVRIVNSADGTRLYCCPMCHMAYPDKSLLEPHLASHKIERRFVCGVCGAGLKRKEHLDRHQLSHSDERPYSCAACPKTFKRNEHLARHYVVHSGEKAEMERRFICGICGAGHARREHLERHRTSHSDARPHSCPACPKTFKRAEHLARHTLVHAGIKPHVCLTCAKAFYRKDHLRKHMAAHQLKQLKASTQPSQSTHQSTQATHQSTQSQGTSSSSPIDKLSSLLIN